jgi:hypothetical protein
VVVTSSDHTMTESTSEDADVVYHDRQSAWLRRAAGRTRCDAVVLWPGVFALVGALFGGGSTLLVVRAIERAHTRRDVARSMLDRKHELYQRTLVAVDELLYMRDDHPDFGAAARNLTNAIVELELLAPPDLAELGEQCATLVLRRPGNPLDAAHARARFAAVARRDLAVPGDRRARVARSPTGRHSRRPAERPTDLADRGLIGPVSAGMR